MNRRSFLRRISALAILPLLWRREPDRLDYEYDDDCGGYVDPDTVHAMASAMARKIDEEMTVEYASVVGEPCFHGNQFRTDRVASPCGCRLVTLPRTQMRYVRTVDVGHISDAESAAALKRWHAFLPKLIDRYV